MITFNPLSGQFDITASTSNLVDFSGKNGKVWEGKVVRLDNPYKSKSNLYKGQVHCHTTNSDGTSSPTDVVTAYKNNGYHFIAISDHNYVTPDPGVSGITFIQNCEEQVAIGTQSPDLSRIGITTQSTSTDPQTVLSAGQAENDFNILNHPDRTGNVYSSSDLERLYDYHAIEIYNSRSVGNYESKLDYIANLNRKVYAISADDMHTLTDPYTYTAAIQVKSDTNTATDIFDNIKRGNFYATYTPSGQTEVVLTISVSGYVITATSNQSSTIEFIGKGGTTLQSTASATTASYTVLGDERYVRVKITAGTAIAWSNPIHVMLEEDPQINELTLKGNLWANTKAYVGNYLARMNEAESFTGWAVTNKYFPTLGVVNNHSLSANYEADIVTQGFYRGGSNVRGVFTNVILPSDATAVPSAVTGNNVDIAYEAPFTLTTFQGFRSTARINNASSTVTSMNLFDTAYLFTAGVITNLNIYHASALSTTVKPVTSIAFRAQNMGQSGTTTSYGLKVESQSGSTTNYGIYTGTGLNLLGDQLSIVGSSNTSQLVIKANATQSNTNPIVSIQKSDGTHIVDIHSDNASNLFIGANSGRVNTVGVYPAGQRNVFVGNQSGYSNTSGSQNVGVGYGALYSTTTGYSNTAIGGTCMQANTEGYGNVAISATALYNNTTGYSNMGIGGGALQNNISGHNNCAVGPEAMGKNETGYYNSAIGLQALKNGTSPTRTVAIGNGAGLGFNSYHGVFIGSNAGSSATTRGSLSIHSADSASANELITGNFDDSWLTIKGYTTIQTLTNNKTLIVKGASAQTADLIEAQISAGNPKFRVSIDGVGNFDGVLRVGDMLTPTTSHILAFEKTLTDTTFPSFCNGVRAIISHQPTANSSGEIMGVYATVNSQPNGAGITNSNNMTAGYFSAATYTRGTQSTTFSGILTGVLGNADLRGNTYTHNIAYGGRFSVVANTGTLTVTKAARIYSEQSTWVAGAVATNYYGLLIDNVNEGTNNYAILTNAGNIIFNEGGDASTDFRVESDTEANMVYLDSNGDTDGILYLGGSTNGIKINKGGELTMLGTATVWDDLRIEPVSRSTGANAPSFEKYYDDAAGTSRGVYLYSFDDATAGSEKEIFFTMQMPHSWAGTAISLHVHWVGAVADTTATPRWGLEYTWKEIGEVFGDTTIIYKTGNTAGDTDITANKHYLTAFDDLTPGTTADGISSILIGRLFRDSANAADTYDAAGAKCGLLYIDAHFEMNTIGSKTSTAK